MLGGVQQRCASPDQVRGRLFEAFAKAKAPQDEDVYALQDIRALKVSIIPQNPNVFILRCERSEPRRTHNLAVAFLSLILAVPAHAHPHSPLGDKSTSNRDTFIQLGEAVHGAFGPLIALGIRIGDDAMKTLGAGPRQIDVTYFEGIDAPCACIVDGIMIISASSPGQGTLRVAKEPAGEGLHGRIVIRHRRSGETVEYRVPASINPLIRDTLKSPPDKRWDIMMDTPEAQLFSKSWLGITR